MDRPRERHHIERIQADASGNPKTIMATASDGQVRFFGAVDEALREAARLGGRAAGYRVITTYVDAVGNPTTFRLTTDWAYDAEGPTTIR